MVRGTKELSALVDPTAPSSEPFRALRLALQLRFEPGAGRAVLFTSPSPGEGKSTVAANYALVSSLSHSKVLLVDGDLRKPALHDFFGLPRSPGLTELVANGSRISVYAQPVPNFANLHVLPAGSPVPRSGDLAASERMAELLRQATKGYELVVIDSPPLLSAADAAGLASHAGVEVVLVVSRSSRRRTTTKALRKLELIEATLAGIVVNRDGRLATYQYY